MEACFKMLHMLIIIIIAVLFASFCLFSRFHLGDAEDAWVEISCISASIAFFSVYVADGRFSLSHHDHLHDSSLRPEHVQDS